MSNEHATKIGFLMDETDALNFKINTTKRRITCKKILTNFVQKFNQDPDKWINELEINTDS